MSDSLAVSVLGIGLAGPGLAGWQRSRDVLRDASRWNRAPTELAAPLLLQPAERRRAGAMVKLSLAVADEASAGIDRQRLATVFSASTGESANCHALCETLATPERLVSPTRFTNSVHNACAGYWHIATQSRARSTSLCGRDASFGAGLLEAAVQCVTGGEPVLLVASDVPYPEPLHGSRPLPDAFGVALLLGARADDNVPRLEVRLIDAPATPCDDAGLEALRTAIPAARSLPLLAALARRASARLVIEYLGPPQLEVRVTGA